MNTAMDDAHRESAHYSDAETRVNALCGGSFSGLQNMEIFCPETRMFHLGHALSVNRAQKIRRDRI